MAVQGALLKSTVIQSTRSTTVSDPSQLVPRSKLVSIVPKGTGSSAVYQVVHGRTGRIFFTAVDTASCQSFIDSASYQVLFNG